MSIRYVLATGKQGVIDSTTEIDNGVIEHSNINASAFGNGLQGGYNSGTQTSTPISVKAKSGGGVTVTSDGVDVQSASASQAGTMSASDFSKLQKIADLVFRHSVQSVNGADALVSIGTMNTNTVAMVEARLCSSSVTNAGNYLIRKQMFGISRNTGNTIAQIGSKTSIAELYNTGANAISGADMTIEADTGNGAWRIRITGVTGKTINHVLTGLVVYLPSPV
jgi:hypothetical protein